MKKRKVSIFVRVLVPFMGLIVTEVVIFSSAISTSRIMDHVAEYSMEVAEGKLTSRKNYLENIMISNWMNVSSAVNELNSITEKMLEEGDATLDELTVSGEKADEFLVEASSGLIRMLRANRVNGAYVLLNTEKLDEKSLTGEKLVPGLYIRDLDPLSAVPVKNTDLLIERSPAAVVKSTGIATDTSWMSTFHFTEESGYYPFFSEPFMKAYDAKGEYEWADLGYWSAPHELENEDRWAISYSVPLMLSDGTVYGVVGADILLDYLGTLLPSAELSDGNDGSYFIAQTDGKDSKKYTQVVATGDKVWAGNIGETYAKREGGENAYISADEKAYYSEVLPLSIYSSNVPYPDTNWVIGFSLPWSTVRENETHTRSAFAVAGLLTGIIGLIGSIHIAFRLRKPVYMMETQLRNADFRSPVKLDETGIREVDRMSKAIEQLSTDVLDAGEKFSKIIRMASAQLGGFQIDDTNGTLFVTDGFFELFEMTDPGLKNLTPDAFRKILADLDMYKAEAESDRERTVYKIRKDNNYRYIKLRVNTEEGVTYGLAEDITQVLLRRRMIEFERDHDALTGLLGRNAFRAKISDLLEHNRDSFKVGALLMIDLDNLKSVNDTYGHEAGDKYIRAAAQMIAKASHGDALPARISGDEFNVFYYGDSRDVIRRRIERLRRAFGNVSIQLANGQTKQVRISAGIAWYPNDAHRYEELQRFADAALYVAKKNNKGEFETFDLDSYRDEAERRDRRAALTTLLEQGRYHYVFQPIVSAETGKVYAYEALIRSDMKEFASPLQILETARSEGKLSQFENETVPTAIRTFFALQDTGKLERDAKLFFNTISSQLLSVDVRGSLTDTYGERLSSLVMEITEEEPIDYASWDEKTGWLLKSGGHIALDDYGTGYNSEKSLLAISPKYIKVDIAIIRNIQSSPDKRAIMEYIVGFAHARGKHIIAEGVETEEEVKTCGDLGADLLQGYYIHGPIDYSERVKEV